MIHISTYSKEIDIIRLIGVLLNDECIEWQVNYGYINFGNHN